MNEFVGKLKEFNVQLTPKDIQLALLPTGDKNKPLKYRVATLTINSMSKPQVYNYM